MNPWLNIPVRDYIDHMEHDSVAQGALLRQHLADCIVRTSAKSLLFLGAGIGNGLGSSCLTGLDEILAVDINPEYLTCLEERYHHLPVRISCCSFPEQFVCDRQFDLVYGALFFEYVELRAALACVRHVLNKDGRLIALLQQRSSTSNVSETGIRSLKRLNEVMTIIPAEQFIARALESGYRLHSHRPLSQLSKSFIEVELELCSSDK